MKKHINDDYYAEQRHRRLTGAIGTVFVSGGLQLDEYSRDRYPSRVAREVRRLGGDEETIATAHQWARELVEEIGDGRSAEALTSARQGAAACATEIARRVHEQVEGRARTDRTTMSDQDILTAVATGRDPGGMRERAAQRAAAGPGEPEGPPTEERRRLVEELEEVNRHRRRKMRESRTG